MPFENIDKKAAYAAYSERRFWHKALTFAKIAGKGLIEKALLLFYAAQSPKTPKWAKTAIYTALGYFIMPIDAIPDVIPVAGLTDDWGVLAAALATVAFYIDDGVRAKARAKMQAWFGVNGAKVVDDVVDV